MVTCTRCGTVNKDEARFCVNCGANLYAPVRTEKEGDTCFGGPERRGESECFGLPNGGAIAGVIIGVLIIFVGLGIFWGQDIGRIIGPAIVIIVGVLIVAGALYGMLSRKRRG